MMNRPPITCREVLKSIEHACQCYRSAEQAARYKVWQEAAGPPQPATADVASSERDRSNGRVDTTDHTPYNADR